MTLSLEVINAPGLEREFFIDNLLIGIHLISEVILEDRPCATRV